MRVGAIFFANNRSDRFFSRPVNGRNGGLKISEVRGVIPTDLCDRPDRSMREYDRSDHPVSSECPCEIPVGKLEHKRPPRPVLNMIGPIIFFAKRQVGVGGRPIFLEAGMADHDGGSGRGFLEIVGL